MKFTGDFSQVCNWEFAVPDTGGAKNNELSGATVGLVLADALQFEVVHGEAGAVVAEVHGIKEVLAV
tara:strand:+ start:520 stop:720 length:201 start_codon:yes stop_codon:yes gene_type:complete